MKLKVIVQSCYILRGLVQTTMCPEVFGIEGKRVLVVDFFQSLDIMLSESYTKLQNYLKNVLNELLGVVRSRIVSGG